VAVSFALSCDERTGSEFVTDSIPIVDKNKILQYSSREGINGENDRTGRPW
jgi:hypothetical protein